MISSKPAGAVLGRAAGLATKQKRDDVADAGESRLSQPRRRRRSGHLLLGESGSPVLTAAAATKQKRVTAPGQTQTVAFTRRVVS
jgi:hypothetical protein